MPCFAFISTVLDPHTDPEVNCSDRKVKKDRLCNWKTKTYKLQGVRFYA